MGKLLLSWRWQLLLALVLGSGYAAQAQVTYSQVPLTAGSFNADVVANGSAAVVPASTPTTGTNLDVDGGGYYFLTQDYNTATATHTSGIPNSGAIPNAIAGYSALTYQLQPVTGGSAGNNSLRIPATGTAQATGTGTAVLVTPTAAAEVYLLLSSGGAASTVTVTLTYGDGTSTSYTAQTVPDWFTANSTVNVFGMTARANSASAVSPATAAGTAPFFDQLKLTIPVDKVTNPIKSIALNKTSTSGILHLFAMSIGTYPVCTVAPATQAQATTTSGGSTALTSACSTTSIYLSLTGAPNYSGYTYQWQSSPDNTTWTNISGATSSTYTATQTAATYYRCLVSCLYDSGSGSTATPSGSVQVNQNSFDACYCTPTHSSGCGTYAPITSVSIAGTPFTNTSTCAASPYYTNYPTSTTTATLAAGTTYTFGTTVGRYGKVAIWIDYNHSGTFDSGEYTAIGGNSSSTAGTTASPTATFTVPLTALTGTTRLRVRSQYYPTAFDGTYGCTGITYGETEDYTITISATACSGVPATTTLTGSASAVCSGSSVTLTASGQAAGTTGLSYQFQSSPTSTGTFTNIGSAQTSAIYTVTSQTAPTSYRVIVTCTNSNLSAVSNVLSVGQSPFYNCYCTPGSNGTNEYITSVTLPGTNGFTSTSNATPDPATPNGNVGGYTDYSSSSALTTTLNQGATYNNGIGLTVRSNAANSTGGLWIDYDHSGTFDASEFTAIGTSSATATLVSFTATLVVPATALTGTTRVRVRWRNSAFTGTAAEACATGWFGEVEDYLITIAASTNCSAPPSSVTASASATNACANGGFTLSASGISTTTTGYTFQWQSSPAGANTFAAISGATTQTYTVSGQSAATDYRLVVSCQYGGSPVTSNVVSVGQNNFDQCYCSPAYTSGCGSYGQITNVQLNTLNYSSTCPATPFYTVVPAGTATTTVNGGSSYTLKITNGNTSTFGVWIDYNQDGTFSSTEYVFGATGSTSGVSTTITIPTTAKGGATRMRVRSNSFNAFSSGSDPCIALDYGEAEDYTITIVAPTACAGTPATPGLSSSTPSTGVCPGSSFTLTATNPANATGLSYQFQSSPAGANTYSNLGGSQTTLTYTVTSQTAATDYRVIATCTSSNLSSPSSVVSVTQSSFLYCYCLPTYANTTSTGDGIAKVVLGPLSNTTGYNAPYTSYTSAQTSATPTLAIPNLTPGTTASVAVTFGTDSNQWGAVWIDFNQNGTFGDVANEYVGATSQTTSSGTYTFALPVPLTAVAGQTRMRVRGGEDSASPAQGQACGASSSVYGEGEDYLVNVLATVACTGTPATTTASASVSSACVGTLFTLSATGIAPGTTGLTYQWQSSPAGANTFAAISGATTNPYTVSGQSAATDYRLVVTCTASSQSSTSNVVSVGQNAFANCYCTPTGGSCANEYVRGVVLNTLSNVGSGTAGTGCTGTGGYTDYTGNAALTTTLVPGSTYALTLNLRINSTPAAAGVWIDYDHSGTFDASEFTQVYSYTGANGAFDVTNTVSLTVPASALTGTTRMRVRSANSSVPLSASGACTNNYYGEVEDYLLTIAADLIISTTGQTVPAGTYNSITVQNGGQGTLAGNVTVLSSTTVQSGGTLNDGCAIISGNGTFTLAAGGTLGICSAAGIASTGATGAVQVTGARSFSTDASYVYNGTVAQSTGTGLPSQVRNLSLANGAGLALTGSVTVSTAATLTSGVLTTGSNAVTLGATATLTENAGGYATGTVQTTRDLSTAGAAESFGGLGLTLTPGGSNLPGSTLVRRVTGTPLSGQGTSSSVGRYFDIQPTVTSGLNVALALTARDDERNGIAPARLRLFKSDDNGTTWQQQAATLTTNVGSGGQPTTYTASLSGITNFSLWTLGDAASPLPVQLVSFAAAADNAGVVRLSWTTASEVNSDRFEVERSTTGGGFGRVGTVAAAGSSTASRHYAWLDASLPAGAEVLYYRLRQVDRDGTATYSVVRSVRPALSQLTLLPNPTHGPATLIGAGAGASVQVLDAVGRVVLATQADAAGQARLVLPTGLATGLYLVRAGSSTVRLMLE